MSRVFGEKQERHNILTLGYCISAITAATEEPQKSEKSRGLGGGDVAAAYIAKAIKVQRELSIQTQLRENLPRLNNVSIYT